MYNCTCVHNVQTLAHVQMKFFVVVPIRVLGDSSISDIVVLSLTFGEPKYVSWRLKLCWAYGERLLCTPDSFRWPKCYVFFLHMRNAFDVRWWVLSILGKIFPAITLVGSYGIIRMGSNVVTILESLNRAFNLASDCQEWKKGGGCE